MGLPRLRRGALAAALPVACAVAAAGCSGSAGSGGGHPGPAASPTASPSASPTPEMGGTLGNLPNAVDRAFPAVVAVAAGRHRGFGVVYNKHGLVVTEYHLVGRSMKVLLTFANGTRGTGAVITGDPAADLALVQVHGSNLDLPTARFLGALPAPGDLAAVVTAAAGGGPPVSAGVVAAIDRDLAAGPVGHHPLDHLIETDVPVPATDAGAPLVNFAGRVLGLVEPVAQRGSGAVGYAIPSPTVQAVLGQLAHSGRVRIGYLGVSTETLTPQLAAGFGPTPTAAPSPPAPSGVVILSVAPGSPAAAARLAPGEVITALDGSAVNTVTQLYDALDQHPPGDQVTLTVYTSGRSRQVPVTLGSPPG